MAERTVREELQRLLPKPPVMAAWFAVAVAFVVFYSGLLDLLFTGSSSWKTSSIEYLLRKWWTEDDYQHGFVVPIFAVVLLWLRRDMIVPFAGRWSWWGLPVLALWAAVYWVSVYFNYGSLPEYSMLVFLAGATIFAGGWQGLRWAWPSIVFLIFMIPLPGFVQGRLSFELQGVATRWSEYVIQTLGIPAMRQGHVILVGKAAKPLDVALACSGLRMMMLFFAMCVGAAFVVRKPLWEKLVIIASAVPIAIVANVARIVLTAILTNSPAVVNFLMKAVGWLVTVKDPDDFIHQCVGIFLMMPLGLLLLWGEVALLSKLLLAPLPERPLMVGKLLAAKEAAEAGNKQTARPKTPR
jgi:exosortase